MPYVYSTATNDTIFTLYEKTEAGQAGRIKKQVFIKGGANVAKGKALITKYGMRTEVSAEELSFLEAKSNFKKMVEAGFMHVSHHKENAESVAAEMEKRDESAPLVPDDYADSDLAKPKDFDADAEREESGDKEDEGDED